MELDRKKPDVSIIVINYNTFQLTCDCLASVIEKTKDVSSEIILVDNASIECDPELFRDRFPEIVLIKSKENLGFAKGNNLGLQNAKADTVLLLNSDTLMINDAVSLSLKKLYTDDSIGAISAQLQYPDGSIQHNAGRFPSIFLGFIELAGINRLFSKEKLGNMYLGFHFDHQREKWADWMWGTFLMIKKEVILMMPDHKLPDHLFMYGEDMEWGYAINKVGYKSLFYPEAKIIHLAGKSNYHNISKAISVNIEYAIAKYKGRVYAKIYMIVRAAYGVRLAIENRIRKVF